MVNNSTWIAKLRVVYSLGLLLIKVTSISCYLVSFHHFIIIIIIIIMNIIINELQYIIRSIIKNIWSALNRLKAKKYNSCLITLQLQPVKNSFCFCLRFAFFLTKEGNFLVYTT